MSVFRAGDKVLLIDAKQRRYLLDLANDAEFHSHAGFVPHTDIIGRDEGTRVQSTRGARYIALRPTLEDFVLEMPRGA
ncbi:MAG: tRNA (adenine-N1)-methyltransferase, partial [Actinomycetota bacterium]